MHLLRPHLGTTIFLTIQRVPGEELFLPRMRIFPCREEVLSVIGRIWEVELPRMGRLGLHSMALESWVMKQMLAALQMADLRFLIQGQPVPFL